MKKFLIIMVILSAGSAIQAQTAKYLTAMQARVIASDTTRTVEGLTALSAAFERIAEAEKDQWLPYYYAALTKVNSGYYSTNGKMGGLVEQLDPIADGAEKLLQKAEALSPGNAEIFVVKKMIATLRMMADPMNRYMQYGPMGAQALETARTLDPENPRVYYLEALDKFHTPEQYGGSKSEAKKLFETAIAKFDQAKPASDIAPHWGRANTQYFLQQIGK